AKKESYLKAEQAKAERQQEYQQRLMVTEKGLRQVAEITAEENQKKARALITKTQAVTVAEQAVEVASKAKNEADMLKQIAQVKSETAEINKRATISAAEAKQKEIELGGGLSQKDQILATIKADQIG